MPTLPQLFNSLSAAHLIYAIYACKYQFYLSYPSLLTLTLAYQLLYLGRHFILLAFHTLLQISLKALKG